jgi:hypothetical protein
LEAVAVRRHVASGRDCWIVGEEEQVAARGEIGEVFALLVDHELGK